MQEQLEPVSLPKQAAVNNVKQTVCKTAMEKPLWLLTICVSRE